MAFRLKSLPPFKLFLRVSYLVFHAADPGCEFRVPGFRIRSSGPGIGEFGFRGFGFWDSRCRDSEFEVLGFGLKGLRCQDSGFEIQGIGFRFSSDRGVLGESGSVLVV